MESRFPSGILLEIPLHISVELSPGISHGIYPPPPPGIPPENYPKIILVLQGISLWICQVISQEIRPGIYRRISQAIFC